MAKVLADTTVKYSYKQLITGDQIKFQHLMKLFADVFEDAASYQSNPPDEKYINDFLRDDAHIVLVAVRDSGEVIGGLVAYELQKFEQNRREIYLYDLAVDTSHQRQSVVTGLMNALRTIAQERGISVIFVQADKEDSGALSFYRTLSTSELDGVVFDIAVDSHKQQAS